MIRFKVREHPAASLAVKGTASIPVFVAGAVVVQGRSDPYEGDYIVTPAVEAQSLATKDKRMEEDLTIKAIPYYDVGNNAGGSTVYIGKEI